MRQSIGSAMMYMTASALAAVVVVGVMVWRQKKKERPHEYSLDEVDVPKEWKRIGEVKELMMYPLKGAKRKVFSNVEFTNIGMRVKDPEKFSLQDRIFVLYNDKHEFVTSKRSNSKILLIETTAVDEAHVKFSLPETEDLVIQIPDSDSKTTHVNLYGESVQTIDCGDEAASWFSRHVLNKEGGLRLGFFLQSRMPLRSPDPAYAQVYKKMHSGYMGAYADIASYMVMSEESVNDLNSRLESPVSEHNFRPNLVVSGCPPYSEDSWDWLKIGDNVILRGFKPCTRCVVTTIDPNTASRDQNMEPLRTLKTYRQIKDPRMLKLEGDIPVMGLYAGCHQSGSVRVGDPVYVNCD